MADARLVLNTCTAAVHTGVRELQFGSVQFTCCEQAFRSISDVKEGSKQTKQAVFVMTALFDNNRKLGFLSCVVNEHATCVTD